MNNLVIAILQIDIIPNDATANCSKIEELIWELDQKVDLILLPELFNIGFHFEKKNTEPKNFTTFKWLKRMSEMTQATIFGSILEKDQKHIYNRSYAVAPDGSYQTYDKRHLFVKSEEPNFCTPGSKTTTFFVKGWKIQPSICFDLRFPVWCRNIDQADLFINIANWPAKRIDTYSTLLKARAIENQVYTIGVNRIGTDLNGGEYNGNSSVFDFKGELLNEPSNREEILITTLEKEKLEDFNMNQREE